MALIADLEKMINKQNLSYQLMKITIFLFQNYLMKLIKSKKLIKSNMISNGDDYQVLFTASSNKSRIILTIHLKNLALR